MKKENPYTESYILAYDAYSDHGRLAMLGALNDCITNGKISFLEAVMIMEDIASVCDEK